MKLDRSISWDDGARCPKPTNYIFLDEQHQMLGLDLRVCFYFYSFGEIIGGYEDEFLLS